MSAQLAPSNAGLLFDSATPATAPAAPAKKPAVPALSPEQIAEKVAAMVAAADMAPSPATADALKFIPEELRPRVSAIADRQLRAEFARLASEVLARPPVEGGWVDPSSTPAMLLSTAKLLSSSSVGYMASQPWHLADAATLKCIGNEMQKGGGLECARRLLMSTKPLNLFVAATDMDDRASYLKSVAAAVRGRKVHNVVLDAELIEWNPEREFLEACEIIGIRPTYVGIVDRRRVGGYSMLNPATTPEAIPLLCIDSDGRPFNLHAEKPAAVAPATRCVPHASARDMAPAANVVAIAPPTAMRDKIRDLQTRQNRMRPAGPRA
jgi:hypothetical protein